MVGAATLKARSAVTVLVRGTSRVAPSPDLNARRRAKRAAKSAIFNAKNAERLKFCEELEDVDRKGNVFRVAKQLVRKNRDVVGAGCVKDNVGKIVVEEDKLLEVWKEHYDRISNEEFSWDREGLIDVRPVCGPGEKISEEEVGAAIGKMKLSKAGAPQVWWQIC